VRRDTRNSNKSERWTEWASDGTLMERNTTKLLLQQYLTFTLERQGTNGKKTFL